MLKILRCGLGTAGRDEIYSEILALTKAGRRSYLIVPEQQTVLTEGVMSELLPPSSPLFFEVTNFTRFANTTFRTLGGISGKYCDKGRKLLLMWRALTELSPLLDMTRGRREISAGQVEAALAAVEEMQSLGVSADELSAAAECEAVMSDRRLTSKLTDLSKITTLYKSLLSERYSDTGDDVEMMIRKLRSHPEFLCDAEIFIEGFTSFTEPQYRLIGLLAERTSVTVNMAIPDGREDDFEFGELRAAEERLKAFARRSGADIKLQRLRMASENTSPLLEISSLLWHKNRKFDNVTLQNPDTVRIFEAREPFEECSFVAADIKRRVMAGASYRDFAIVARRAESYDGILDAALSGADIPHFTGRSREADSFEAVKLIYTAYAILRSGFAREDLFTYMKCGMSGVSREALDELEMYASTWQISGRRFTDGELWNMNPDGYTTRKRDGTDEKLARINRARFALISPLVSFERSIKAARTVREHAEALVGFLTEIGLEDSLRERSEALLRLGESEYAEENLRLWPLICDSLDTLVECNGELECDRESFIGQLRVLLGSLSLAKIPAHLDEVTVGSADMLRLHGKRHVYLIGVNAGEFPASPTDSSFFSERDKETLSSLGMNLSPDLEIKGARELYIFSRAFCYGEESVTLLYSATDTKYKSLERATVIDRIGELCGIRTVKIPSLPISERLFSAEAALEQLGSIDEPSYGAVRDALIDSGRADILRIGEGSITNGNMQLGESVRRAGEGKPLALTQTRIDSFSSCPLGYFCRFTVGLSEDKRAELDAPGIGSFIHAVLENFFRALGEGGRTASSLTDEERDALTRAAAEKYISELGEGGISPHSYAKIKLNRLCRAARPVVDGLCEEFSKSAFTPRFFELKIGGKEGGSPNPVAIKTDKGDVTVYGTIDRVDTYKRGNDVYLRVVDYKTGQKEFSPDDMAEGRNLQMFLYLKALLDSEKRSFREAAGAGDGGRLLPAGVIYVKTSVRDTTVDRPDDEAALAAVKAEQKREGMVLRDEEIISAMGLEYTPLYSARTPDKIPPSKEKYLFTEEGLSDIMSTVEDSVRRVADGIREGCASATPRADKSYSPCDYCEFKPICRTALTKRRRH